MSLKDIIAQYKRVIAGPPKPVVGSDAVVYFMQDAEDASRPVKIGVSDRRSLAKRRNSVQTGHPGQLRILGVLPCRDRTEAFNTERRLHQLFDYDRVSGEWFEPSESLFAILRRARRY